MTAASSIPSLRLSHVWDCKADEHDGDCGANVAMLYRRARLHAIPADAADTSERPSWLDRLFGAGRA